MKRKPKKGIASEDPNQNLQGTSKRQEKLLSNKFISETSDINNETDNPTTLPNTGEPQDTSEISFFSVNNDFIVKPEEDSFGALEKQPDSITTSFEETYEVEMLLAKRGKRANKQYLVRWKNYSDNDTTWEPVDNLNCKEIIKAFEESIKEVRFKLRKPEDPTLLHTLGSKLVGYPLAIFLTHNIIKFLKLLVDEVGPAISVINSIDDFGPPEGFTIISRNIYGVGVPSLESELLVGCLCSEGCTSLTRKICSCHNIANKPNTYDKSRSLIIPPNHAIFECNSNCLCPLECTNKVVQRGRKVRLQIFRTALKGWGVRALERISSGKFIIEYLGEIITKLEADSRNLLYDVVGKSCILDLDFNYNSDEECLYSIDSYKFSNISRFINHSCEPNIALYPVFYESPNLSIHSFAFYSIKVIESMEEICFDYLNGIHIPDDPLAQIISNGFDNISNEEIAFEMKNEIVEPNDIFKPNSIPQKINQKHRCYCESSSCRKHLPVY